MKLGHRPKALRLQRALAQAEEAHVEQHTGGAEMWLGLKEGAISAISGILA